jgi:copper chaperone CopZ
MKVIDDDLCETSGCCSSKGTTMMESDADAATGCNSNHHRHEHDHHHHHHHHHSEDNSEESVLCLAVVRENGTDIVIFDASGVAVTFRLSSKQDLGKLCFQTHGSATVTGDDRLLTPCFDEFGNHGVPEESCFCGVATPHIHAHLRDMCRIRAKQQREDQNMLASQILYPVQHDADDIGLILPVSESMPKACNSLVIQQQFQERRDQAKSSYKDYKSSDARRILHPVQHDDHTDFLVHNAATGELHLEHPCNDCGSDDVHGRFQNVGKRRLRHKSTSKDVHLHFFEVSPTPFNVLEHFPDIFETRNDRVTAVEKLFQTPTRSKSSGSKSCLTTFLPMELLEPHLSSPSTTLLARSILVCDKICCSAEVPMVRSILEGLEGMEKLLVNVPLKQVIVHHDPQRLSASDIATALNKNHFGATVKRDGGAEMRPADIQQQESGRSQLHVQHICCASEIPAILKILQPIHGVTNVSISTTTKMVQVDHIFGSVSAQQLVDALNQQGFGATLKFDAASVLLQPQSVFVRSTFTFDTQDPDTKALTQLLKSYDRTQVETFVVDVPSKSMDVFHNPFCLSVQDIAAALFDRVGILATVSMDGAGISSWNLPEYKEAEDAALEADTPTYPRPTVVLCGICWIVSMLSYIGSNWYVRVQGSMSLYSLRSAAPKLGRV